MRRIFWVILSVLSLGFFILAFSPSEAAETPTMVIEEAKFVIEEARKAGGDRIAADDYHAAKLWLAQAEKEYAEAQSFRFRMSTEKSRKAKEEEILYLGNMAKLKALIAEAKARKDAVGAKLRNDQKDLTDFQNAIAVLQKKLEEAQKAKEAQAKAEAERLAYEEARRKASEMELQKKRELEEAQRKAAELEALKKKELEELRRREAEREKEFLAAKLQAEQLAAQRAKEAAEARAREEKLAEERRQMEALRKRAEALEREKAMIAEASKIAHATVKAAEGEIIITIVAVNLFTPQNEVSAAGRSILDEVGKFLNDYPGFPVEIRGHTDTTGSAATNQAISEKRAQKVREYLVVNQNILPTRITAKGLGPSQPVATNATEAGRALNRRVEIALQTKEK